LNLANQNTEELILLCRQKNQKHNLKFTRGIAKLCITWHTELGRTLCGRCYAEGFLKAFIKIAYQNEVAFGAWLIINSSIDFTRKNQIHI
jgi:RNA polymerase sigma-70 factor (ECF subfamily)